MRHRCELCKQLVSLHGHRCMNGDEERELELLTDGRKHMTETMVDEIIGGWPEDNVR